MRREQVKRGIVVNTQQDLSSLDLRELAKLREKASDLGLSAFVERIDETRKRLKTALGRVGEREQCYLEVFGKLPLPERAPWLRSALRDGKLLLEIAESEIVPLVEPGRTGWVWEMSGAADKRRRDELREQGRDVLDGWLCLVGDVQEAYSIKARVFPVLYHPVKGGKGNRFRVIAGVEGSVVAYNDKTHSFKVVFIKGEAK